MKERERKVRSFYVCVASLISTAKRSINVPISGYTNETTNGGIKQKGKN